MIIILNLQIIETKESTLENYQGRFQAIYLFYYLLLCLYDFIVYSYFSLRRLDAASIPANVASPNPANPVLVSVVPVLANLLT